MAVLSIKDFDESLMSLVKSGAALKQRTIKEHVENLIRQGMNLEVKESEAQTPKRKR